jgi:photosystem II stability/assembly factor-like uncharacterized protein
MKRLTLIILVVIVSPVFAHGAALAGESEWTSMGPYGGIINCLAIDPITPSTLNAGTYNGVYKSSDGGAIWSAINAGLVGPFVSALAIDPITPSILYAGGYYGNIYKSTDGGGNWSTMNPGLPDVQVLYIEIDPITPSTLYAGTTDGVYEYETVGDGGTPQVATGVGGGGCFIDTLAHGSRGTR